MIGKKSFEIGPNEWLSGATSGANTTDGGFSNETDQVNITKVPGVLYAPSAVTDESSGLGGNVIATCEDGTYLGEDRWLLDDVGKFYTFDGSTTTERADSTSTFVQGTTDIVNWYNTSTGTAAYATTQAGAGGDIVRVADSGYAVDEDWWLTTLGQAALSAFTSWRPLLIYEANLYVGDQNKLHRIAPDLTVSNGILELNYLEAISALGIDQGTGRMLIATSNGSNYSGTLEVTTRIHVYDGFSNKSTRVVPIHGLVTAFKNVGNVTYVFYGNKLGYWTGSGVEFLRTLNFEKTSAAYIVYPHRTCAIDNTLYWADTIPGGNHNQIMAHGETINGVRAFYPALQPLAAGTGSISTVFPVRSHELGYTFPTNKFSTFDTEKVSTSSGFNLKSKRYTFPRNVTFNGVLIELDQAAPSGSDTSLNLRVTDDKGNTTSFRYLVTSGRTDIYTWEFDQPTIETRSLQFKLGRAADALTVGVRRMTVFYTPKE